MRHAIPFIPARRCESCGVREARLYVDTYLCDPCRERLIAEAAADEARAEARAWACRTDMG